MTHRTISSIVLPLSIILMTLGGAMFLVGLRATSRLSCVNKASTHMEIPAQEVIVEPPSELTLAPARPTQNTDIEEMKTRLKDAEDKASFSEAKLTIERESNEPLRKQLNEERLAKEAAQTSYRKLEQKQEVAQANISNLHKELERAIAEKTVIQQQLSQLQQELEAVKSENTSSEVRLKELREKVETLKEEKSTIESVTKNLQPSAQ